MIGLEKFSLIKWDRENQTLVIHRLIQTVVKDEMSDGELTYAVRSFVDMCRESWPFAVSELRSLTRVYTPEQRELCLRYQSQMVEPLLQAETVRTEKCADIKELVGNFLTGEGNHKDSERLRLQVVQVRTELLGIDHRDTITGLHKLAWTYMVQG